MSNSGKSWLVSQVFVFLFCRGLCSCYLYFHIPDWAGPSAPKPTGSRAVGQLAAPCRLCPVFLLRASNPASPGNLGEGKSTETRHHEVKGDSLFSR